MSIDRDLGLFTEVIDRRNTASVKWDHSTRGVLPFWLMDMDFQTPSFIIDAIRERLGHRILGYTYADIEMTKSLVDNLDRHHGWSVDPDWVVWMPSVAEGMRRAAGSVGDAGDAVMMNTPIYYKFPLAPGLVDREAILVPMSCFRDPGSGRESWSLDFDAMEASVTPRTRLFYLVNPQNPVGRVFGEDELRQLLDFCERHGLVLCSDDVHSKMVIDRSKEHVPVAKLADAFVDRTMTLLSSTKTYNISGTGCAAAVIPSPEIRKAFAAMGPDPIHLISPLSRAATLAALEDSSSYVSELQEALRANWRAVGDAFDALDGVWLTDAESTYNAWVNVKDLGLKSPVGYFMKHGVHLADGKGYGASGYVRMNFACPPKTLDEGLRRIRAGIESL